MIKFKEAVQSRQVQVTTALVTLAAGGSLASAQTGGAGQALNGMTTAAGAFVTDLVSSNAGPLMTAMLPVLGLVFIKNQVRSIF